MNHVIVSVIKHDNCLLYLSLFRHKYDKGTPLTEYVPISLEKVDIFDYKLAIHCTTSKEVKVTFAYTTKEQVVIKVILVHTDSLKIYLLNENSLELNNTKILKIRIIGELLFLIDFNFNLFWIIKKEITFENRPFLLILKKFQSINNHNSSTTKLKSKVFICQPLSIDCIDVLVLLKNKKVIFLIQKHTQIILHKFRFYPKNTFQNTALFDAAHLIGDSPYNVNLSYFNCFDLRNLLIIDKIEGIYVDVFFHCNHTSDVLDIKKIENNGKIITNLFSKNICIPAPYHSATNSFDFSFYGFFLLLDNNTTPHCAMLHKGNIKIVETSLTESNCFPSILNHCQNNLNYLKNDLNSFIVNSKVKEFIINFLLCTKKILNNTHIHLLCIELIFENIKFDEMYKAIFRKSNEKKRKLEKSKHSQIKSNEKKRKLEKSKHSQIKSNEKKRNLEKSKHNQRKKRKTKKTDKYKKIRSSKQISSNIVLNFDLLKKNN